MSTLVKVLAAASVLVAFGALPGTGVAATRSSDVAKCLRAHGVDTSRMKEYPNGIRELPSTGPDVRRALSACVRYAPITGKPKH